MTIAQLQMNGDIAILTINRPESLNALGLDGDGAAFEAACREINANQQLRAVILTGAGRAFSSGGDVKAMRDKTGMFGGSPVEIRHAYKTNVHALVNAIWNIEVPVIAAVNGPAIGLGCDVACLADIRVASKNARFGVTFLKIGLIPGDGGAWLSPRVFGYSRAAQLLFTGETIDAQTALNWGVVGEVTEPDELMDAAIGLADRIAKQPPHALRITKALMRKGQISDFSNIMELSATAQGLMHHSQDHLEGVNAILEKREPNFIGK